MKIFRTLAAAALTLGLAVTAVAAGPKGYGQYPCDPHPGPTKFPPITKLPPTGPKQPSPAPQTAPAKVAKGK